MQRSVFAFFIVLTVIIGSGTAQGNKLEHSSPSKLRDITDLEKHLNQNKFSNIEEFIQSLPKEMTAFRTYVKKSLSLQSASLKNPRAIVSAPDGGLIITFNGYKSQKGFNEVEVMAVDNKNKPTQWVTAVIEQSNGSLHFQKNIARCNSCHGSPARPIWGNYPEWPNFYGSVDDWLPDPNNLEKGSTFFQADRTEKGSGQYENSTRLNDERLAMALEESRHFRQFRKRALSHPRYSVLEENSPADNPVYPYTEEYRTRNYSGRVNLVMGSVITLKHSQIMANRIRTNDFFKRYKSSFLHYASCGTYNYPFAYNKKIHQTFAKRYASIFKRSYHEDNSEIFSNRYLDLFGLKLHEKTFLFESDTFYIKSPNDYFFSGFFTISGSASRILFEEYVEQELNTTLPEVVFEGVNNGLKSSLIGDELSSVLSKGNERFFVPDGELSEQGQSEYEDICRTLKSRSELELAKPIPPLPKIETAKTAWPTALGSCIKCHEGTNKVAQHIPFSSPSQLKIFNGKYVSSIGFGDISEASWIMTDSKMAPASANGKRMPLGHPPLSETERSAIRNWILNAIK